MYGLKRHPNPTFQAESSLSRSSSTSSTPSRLSSLTSNWPMPAEMYGPEGFSSSWACAAPAPARARRVAVAARGRKIVLEGSMAGPLLMRCARGADLQLWLQLALARISGTYAQGVSSTARITGPNSGSWPAHVRIERGEELIGQLLCGAIDHVRGELHDAGIERGMDHVTERGLV